MSEHPQIQGMVAHGFEEVRDEFVRNFAERGEIGAAVAAYWRGEKVVDLWGGRHTLTQAIPDWFPVSCTDPHSRPDGFAPQLAFATYRKGALSAT